MIVFKKPCPKYEKEYNEIIASKHFVEIDKQNADLYKFLSKQTGSIIKKLSHLESLYNTVEAENNLNIKLPSWTNKVLDGKVKDLAALSLASYTFTDTTKRLRGGPLLGEIVIQMSKKALTTLIPDRSIFLYSVHDVTMVSFMRAMGFTELIKPDYGATIIIELHQPPDKGHTVKFMFLNNTSQKEPIQLNIPHCEGECKLEDLLKLTMPYIPAKWEQECKLE